MAFLFFREGKDVSRCLGSRQHEIHSPERDEVLKLFNEYNTLLKETGIGNGLPEA